MFRPIAPFAAATPTIAAPARTFAHLARRRARLRGTGHAGFGGFDRRQRGIARDRYRRPLLARWPRLTRRLTLTLGLALARRLSVTWRTRFTRRLSFAWRTRLTWRARFARLLSFAPLATGLRLCSAAGSLLLPIAGTLRSLFATAPPLLATVTPTLAAALATALVTPPVAAILTAATIPVATLVAAFAARFTCLARRFRPGFGSGHRRLAPEPAQHAGEPPTCGRWRCRRDNGRRRLRRERRRLRRRDSLDHRLLARLLRLFLDLLREVRFLRLLDEVE